MVALKNVRARKTHGEKGEGRDVEEKRKKERRDERVEEGEIERKRGRGRGKKERLEGLLWRREHLIY